MASIGKTKSAERFSSIVHFRDADMRRATRLCDVLRCGGRILANSVGSVDTYGLSAPVDKIDAFVSHNWATGRSAKFLVLAVHFNSDAAVFVAITCSLLAGAAILAGLVPIYESDYLTAYIATPCTGPAYLIALLLKHELLALVGRRGPRLFLDKVCIDQRTDAAKVAGIQSLAAFLNESSCMVVCYTDLYLQKLWTVYEMATFIQVRGEDTAREIHLLPTAMCFVSILCGAIFYVLTNIMRLSTLFQSKMGNSRFALVSNLFAVIASIVLTIPLRVWMKRRMKARDACSTFKIRDALCANEDDRKLVEANSIALMKAYGYCRKDAGDDEAMEAFNGLVRETVPQAFIASTGRMGCPYRLILPMCLVAFSWGMDRVMAMAAPGYQHAPLQEVLLFALMLLTNAFCVLPVAVAAAMFAARFCQHLCGFKEALYTLFVGCVGAGMYIACDHNAGLMSLLYVQSTSSNAAYGVCVGYTVVMLILTLWVYRPMKPPLVRRRTPGATESDAGDMHAKIAALADEHGAVAAKEAPWREILGLSDLECVRQAV